MSYSLYNICLI